VHCVIELNVTSTLFRFSFSHQLFYELAFPTLEVASKSDALDLVKRQAFFINKTLELTKSAAPVDLTYFTDIIACFKLHL
jgi:hypothetical protein